MSGMTSERLTGVRARQESRQQQANAAHAHGITLGPSHLWSAMRDMDDLLAHVDHLTAENARLRAGIAALTSVGYSHTPDCEADDWQRVAHGGHPDCGLCWEDKLATLLNPPTEGETDADT